MKTLLGTGNSKTSKNALKTATFGLPRGKTCPQAGTCKRVCFGGKGSYLYPSVKACQARRLVATKAASFEVRVQAELTKGRFQAVRVHDTGDFYTLSYLKRWLKLARSNPNVLFYAYTTSILMVQGVRGGLPANFKVIYSCASKQVACIDKTRDRHAQIFKTREGIERAGYAYANDDDLVSLGANHKIGLVKH